MKIESIEIRHASDAVAGRVRAWFQTERKVGAVDGSRSIHLPHPERQGFTLKIKGAGYRGGDVRFGTLSKTGPMALAFDFDGRGVPDLASGHDNAFLGAASFQQAATEFNVSRLVSELGMPVVPCLGYGRINTQRHSAWFSIFDWHRDWSSAGVPREGPLDGYLEANYRMTEVMLSLAREHDLIGYCGLVQSGSHDYLLKDLHPFRQTNPISCSNLSWVMQVMFTINIRCQINRFFPAAANRADIFEEVVAHTLRPVLADATPADYEAMRTSIVKPYMRVPAEPFDPRDLLAALQATRIGSALLSQCPEKYTRW